MGMQIVCRFCIYVSQHACWDQPLYLHTHIQEHRLAPSAFKGKYLYCVLSCLLWVVYVSQVSLMSVPISLSLCHSHRSFCELWGGMAKSVHVLCSILVCDCVSYQDPTLRKAGISHHACCWNQSVQFITLHVISVRAGAECACHCYAGGAACDGWHGNWEVVQKTALCQHRPRQSRGRTAGERTPPGRRAARFSHLWRTHGGMRLLSRHGRADTTVTMCTSLPHWSACRDSAHAAGRAAPLSRVPPGQPRSPSATRRGLRLGQRAAAPVHVGAGGRESGHPTCGPLPPRSGSAPAAAWGLHHPPPPPPRRGRAAALRRAAPGAAATASAPRAGPRLPPPRAARPANERRPHAAAARGARAAQLP